MATTANQRPLLARVGSLALSLGVFALVYNVIQILPGVNGVESFFYWLLNPAGGGLRPILVYGMLILIPLGIVLLVLSLFINKRAMAAGAAAASGAFGSQQQREWAQHQQNQQAAGQWNAQQGQPQHGQPQQWDAQQASAPMQQEWNEPAPAAGQEWNAGDGEFGDAPSAPTFGDPNRPGDRR